MHHIAHETEYPAGNAVITEEPLPFCKANSLLYGKPIPRSGYNGEE